MWNYVEQQNNDSRRWQFGLNREVVLKSIVFNNAGVNDAGNNISENVTISFGFPEDIDESGFKKLRVYAPNEKEMYYKGEKVFAPSEEFKTAYQKEVRKCSRTLLDLAECFVSPVKLEEFINKAKPNSFKAFAELIIKAIGMVDYKTIKLDLFLQYSSKLYEGKQFLEVPNANQGHYVVKHQEGDYREERIEGQHLKYFLWENDVKTGKMHPILRGSFEYWWKNNATKLEFKEDANTGDDWLTSSKNESPTENKSSLDWDSLL